MNSDPIDLLLLGETHGWHVDQLGAAAGRRRIKAYCAAFNGIVAEVDGQGVRLRAEGLDFGRVRSVLVRSIPAGSLEQVVLRMDLLHQLMAAGTRVVNPPGAIEACVDKFVTTARLCRAGLPVPRTVACESSEQALAAFDDLGGDVVVKPIFGAEGRGILRVDSLPLAERVFGTLRRLQAVCYLQEVIEHPGYDVRALVLGDRVVTSMRRWATGDFRCNVAQGGSAEPHELPTAWADLAAEAARAVGAPLAGVDLLPGPDGEPLVIEVNSAPGFRRLTEVTGVDVAGAVVEFVTG